MAPRARRVREEILSEARLGYGVIALGAAEEPSADHLLSPVLDNLLIESPIPLLLVRRGRGIEPLVSPTFENVLVPVSGTPSSRAGQEVACNLGRALGTRVVLAHVVTRGEDPSASPTPAGVAGAPWEQGWCSG